MRTEVKSTKANNSTLTAPVPEVQDIFNLSDEEIIHRFKSLSESEIRDLAPVLRILFCMLLIHNDKR